MRLKRFHRRAFLHGTTCCEAAKGRQLPSVRRNVPEVCRKTRSALVSPPGTGLKPFN
jgi:hypothetical protein